MPNRLQEGNPESEMSAPNKIASGIEEQLPLARPGGAHTKRSVRDAGVVLMSVFLLTLLMMGIAYGLHWLRIGRRRQIGSPADVGVSTSGHRRSLPRRRRRRRSKGALPSLAETRGLPPKRTNLST